MVRLLLDEMYPPALAEKLRAGGIDTVGVAAEPGLVGMPDDAVLADAARQSRCLVTENVRDFAVLAGSTSHSGILFVHARRWPRRPSGITLLVAAIDALASAGQIPGADEVRWL